MRWDDVEQSRIRERGTLLDGKGGFVKPETATFLKGFLTAFETWIGKVRAYRIFPSFVIPAKAGTQLPCGAKAGHRLSPG